MDDSEISLFYVREPVDLFAQYREGAHKRSCLYSPVAPVAPTDDRGPALRLEPHRGRIVDPRRLYVAFSPTFKAELAFLDKEKLRSVFLTRAARRTVFKSLGLPRIGGDRTNELSLATFAMSRSRVTKSSAIRIALLNRYSAAFGDSILMVTALRETRRYLGVLGFERMQITMLHHPTNLEAEDLYVASKVIDGTRHLPVPLSELSTFDAYVDMTGEREGYQVPRIDEFLTRLGLDPATIPAKQKRNAGSALAVSVPTQSEIERLRCRHERLVLFHPRASNSFAPPQPLTQFGSSKNSFSEPIGRS